MNGMEEKAWMTFVLVSNKAMSYAEFVTDVLTAFRNLGCNRNIKIYYLFSYMDDLVS